MKKLAITLIALFAFSAVAFADDTQQAAGTAGEHETHDAAAAHNDDHKTEETHTVKKSKKGGKMKKETHHKTESETETH